MKLETPDLTYQNTRSSTYACEYHIIWCTKYRRTALSAEIQVRFKALVLESQEKYGYIVRAVETMTDHVHLLISIPPTQAVGIMIGKIKGMTAKVLREEFPHLKSRLPNLWTRSYFVASTGGVTLQSLKEYVENQKGI
ncbi:IS200/IS605 family transposase [Candidatus Poribacteria bacterium]|nr:IS200/IS605 family transposase [Candidatus Poribacteria bacterium]MYH80955.1 IS200/IS605 family transposase [Candidatus Poribacteria bacterium]MYK94551.1 IS200/IS605 family transposase [Candidatus Poribacteria bacterium]